MGGDPETAEQSLQPPSSGGKQLVRFLVVGASNTVITLATFAALVSAGVFYVAAGVVGWTAGVFNGYFWNRTWTFRAGDHRNELLARYVAVSIGGLLVNSTLLALAVDVLGLGKLMSQVIVLPVVTLASFSANRLWTFRDHLEASMMTPDVIAHEAERG